MDTYNISEAKAQLSALIEQVVEGGEDIIISKAGRPVVRLTRFAAAKRKRRLGMFAGKIRIAKDFDQWPVDVAKALGILD